MKLIHAWFDDNDGMYFRQFYHEGGRIQHDVVRSIRGQVQSEAWYNYNGSALQSINHFSADSRLVRSDRYEGTLRNEIHFDERESPYEVHVFDNETGKLLTKDFLDSEGRISETRNFTSSGELEFRFVSHYDVFGRRESDLFYDGQGNLKQKSFYDSRGRINRLENYVAGSRVENVLTFEWQNGVKVRGVAVEPSGTTLFEEFYRRSGSVEQRVDYRDGKNPQSDIL